MAVQVDIDALGEGKSGDYTKETCIIPDGFQACRLVSYIEMGHHTPRFNGKKQVYEAPSKRVGEVKDAEMVIHLVFEFTDADYTGDYPLTLKTSIPFGKVGELLNKLSISKGLEEGWVSREIALKQNYVKTLMAMQAATNTKYPSLADYVGTVFGVTVTHTLGKKADEDGNIPTYANMKTTSLVAPTFRNPVTKEVIKITLPEQHGEYCKVFDWNAPTMEAWGEVPKYLKDFIMGADDYEGSTLHIMLSGMEEPPAQAEKCEDDPGYSIDPDAPADSYPDDDLPF